VIEKTWAVIVNWNGGEANLSCLRSLLEQGLEPERIVFVDNASTDGSRERVEEQYPEIRVLRNDRNVGYGDGNNRGIEVALAGDAERVFLVNNDVTLPENALAELAAAFDLFPGTGIVGPRVVYKKHPDIVWCAGGLMTWRQNMSTMIGHGRPDRPAYQETREVDYVPGCAMLVRRSVFEKVGLLEGDYFAYHEDVEFCMKAREAGIGIHVIGEVLVFHDAHFSTGGGYNPRRKYMMGVNTVWFLRRHGTPWRWLRFFFFDVLSLPLLWGLRSRRGEGASVRAKARGMLDGARGRRVTDESLRQIAERYGKG
jgi:GT2 family glycosyltransferase